MKIATLSNAAAIHTRRWVSCFRGFGHEVRLFSIEDGPAYLDPQALPREPVPGFLRYPLAVPALRRALDAFRPDLVDAHYVPNYGVMGTLAGVRPLAVTAWGSDLLIAGRRDPFQRWRARFVLRGADLVLADSANLAAAARFLGAPPDRTHAIPWGVERSRFERLPPREPGLLFTSRMHEPIYGIPVILAAARTILERHPETRLVVAGDGSERARLERLAAERLPADRVRFVGLLEPPAIAEWLGRADVYLSASRSDSTSISLLEAMAAGAVPVVTDLDGNREWVSEGDGARLFPPGDVAALVEALERALGDRDWLEVARARNRDVIEERGSWDRNMRRIERLFRDLAAGRGASPGPRR